MGAGGRRLGAEGRRGAEGWRGEAPLRDNGAKGLGALGPGVEVPLEFHVTLRLHGVHDGFEGAMELEADLGAGGRVQRGTRHNLGTSEVVVTTQGAQGDMWQPPRSTHRITGTQRGRMAVR